MIPYVVFVILTVLLALWHDNSRGKARWLPVLLLLVVWVLFAGLRDSSVGTDSGGYARSFTAGVGQIEGDAEAVLSSEPGFWVIQKIARLFTKEYFALFIAVALATYACVITAVRQATDRILLPLFVFICLGYYTFAFNGARQAIAIAVYALSFKYIYESKPWKYVLVVLIAAMFHRTVIVALPMYFLFRIKFSARNLVIIAALGVAISMLLPTLFSVAGQISEKYANYAEMDYARGGELLTLFYVLITAYFIFMRGRVNPEFLRAYDMFLNMMMLGSMIYLLVQINGLYVELTRFAAYFQIASIFIWDLIYRSARRPGALLTVGIVVGHLVFFAIFVKTMAALTPFTFNQDLFYY